MNENKPILTITGSDSTGGSGVQADIKTISALGGHAVSAITSITVQTTLGIQEFFDIPANIVAGQIEAVMNDMQPEVVKVGLIRTVEALQVVVNALTRFKPRHIVYDPVFFSSHGESLIPDETVKQIKCKLLPLCTLIINRNEYLSTSVSHGLANSFSSAVAVFLSQGDNGETALTKAKAYVNTQIIRSSGLQGRSSELYNEFMNAVSAHFKTNSDVAFYADQLNVSHRYLAQVTKRISGRAPKTIIDDYLIHEIEIQLNTTDKTIQEIAYAFGFSSQAHFTKFFKKIKRITPTDFRTKR